MGNEFSWKDYFVVGWAFFWRLYAYSALASLIIFPFLAAPVLLGYLQPSDLMPPNLLIAIPLGLLLEIFLIFFVLAMTGKGVVNKRYGKYKLMMTRATDTSE